MIDRRTCLLGVASLLGLAASPPIVLGQPTPKVRRIGFLGGSSPTSPESRHIWQAFLTELRDLGYVEGRDFVIEGRYYGDNLDRLPAFATDLVRLQVDVIVAAATPAPEAAMRATSTIPIVMANHADPVGAGLVASFARPGGNVTGLSLVATELRVKWMELAKELLPSLTRVAFLRIPSIPLDTRELELAARRLNVEASFVDAKAPGELPSAFAAAARNRAGAVIVLGGSMFFAHRGLLAELAARHRLPTITLFREFVEAGGLMSYGVDLRDSFRRAAGYVDRILRGAKPGDLPIEQPTKFELAINLKTARTLGVTVSPALLARATEVIE